MIRHFIVTLIAGTVAVVAAGCLTADAEFYESGFRGQVGIDIGVPDDCAKYDFNRNGKVDSGDMAGLDERIRNDAAISIERETFRRCVGRPTFE